MDAMTLLYNRASNPKLGEPGPDAETLREILDAAVRAPDHGLLRPWRLWTIQGVAREKLGEVLAEAQRRREPDTDEAQLEKTRAKPLRAPLIVVVAACPQPSEKVPEIEQVLAAGSVAQNMLLASQARGFGAMWRTGAPAYDTHVKQAFGLGAHDHIVGFVYIGTPTQTPPEIPRPGAETFTRRWPSED